MLDVVPQILIEITHYSETYLLNISGIYTDYCE